MSNDETYSGLDADEIAYLRITPSGDFIANMAGHLDELIELHDSWRMGKEEGIKMQLINELDNLGASATAMKSLLTETQQRDGNDNWSDRVGADRDDRTR